MAFSERTRLVSNSLNLTDESPTVYFENIDTFAPYVNTKCVFKLPVIYRVSHSEMSDSKWL